MRTGYFLLSLDTELAWGHYDFFSPDLHARIARQEREAIPAILDLLDEFQIAATWGLVGHMFFPTCEECELCPILSWQGRYPAYEQIRNNGSSWYGVEAIERLFQPGSRHEIAFHGYTHRIFDDHTFSRADAQIEIHEWIRVAHRKGLVPTAVIFPRNRIGFLDVFRESGFTCFRGPLLFPHSFSLPIIGRALKFADSVLQFAVPEVYDLAVAPSGLVNLPSSRVLLGIHRPLQLILDAVHLPNLGIERLVLGVKKAAREGKVIHISTHPYEFTSPADFRRLRHLLTHVAEHVRCGRLQSTCMSDLAAVALRQHAAAAATNRE